jgi:hypothetical protein
MNSFWNWAGQYIGYRSADNLFDSDGRQIGYFAEGDEVYGCAGKYTGEIRGANRLITNLSKKAWMRKTVDPCVLKKFPGQRDLDRKELPNGFEDFPTSTERG